MQYQVAICLQPSVAGIITSLMTGSIGATLDKAFPLSDEEGILLFTLQEDEDIERLGRLILQRKVEKGHIISFFMALLPGEDEGSEDDNKEDAADLAKAAMKLLDEPGIGNSFGHTLSTVFSALGRFIDLEWACSSPRQYIELPAAPAMIFPLPHAESGNIIWIEVYPTHDGLQITTHQSKPTIAHTGDECEKTGMAGIHLDYYTEDHREILQVQLYDETFGPYEDQHWEIPPFDTESISLVDDVQAWKPSESEEQE